jgi:hypothetical protein
MMMRWGGLFVALAVALLAAPLAAGAQAPQRVFRIGVLAADPVPPDVTMYDPGFAREMLPRSGRLTRAARRSSTRFCEVPSPLTCRSSSPRSLHSSST